MHSLASRYFKAVRHTDKITRAHRWGSSLCTAQHTHAHTHIHTHTHTQTHTLTHKHTHTETHTLNQADLLWVVRALQACALVLGLLPSFRLCGLAVCSYGL